MTTQLLTIVYKVGAQIANYNHRNVPLAAKQTQYET